MLPSFQPFNDAFEMLSMLSPRQSFADCVAREGSLWRLLVVLERTELQEEEQESSLGKSQSTRYRETVQRKTKGWPVLESLTSSPSIASQLLTTSAWIELLGVLVGYTAFTKVWVARLGAAKTLSRLLWDPVTGPGTCECT